MIYDKIKELRLKANISQAELAKRLNVTRSSVNAWEMGISTPTTQYVVEMAQIFRVSTDYILGVTNDNVLALDGLNEEEIHIIYSMVNYFNKKHK